MHVAKNSRSGLNWLPFYESFLVIGAKVGIFVNLHNVAGMNAVGYFSHTSLTLVAASLQGPSEKALQGVVFFLVYGCVIHQWPKNSAGEIRLQQIYSTITAGIACLE